MKILELFSGYGTASFALKRLGIDYECVGYSDIDKYANQCFKQNHYNLYSSACGFEAEEMIPIKELGDCKKIDPNELPDFDLLTGGFPCCKIAFSETDDSKIVFFWEIKDAAENTIKELKEIKEEARAENNYILIQRVDAQIDILTKFFNIEE